MNRSIFFNIRFFFFFYDAEETTAFKKKKTRQTECTSQRSDNNGVLFGGRVIAALIATALWKLADVLKK